MLKINYNRNHQLNFKTISHLDQKEASQILNQLNISPNHKNQSREENLIPRNNIKPKNQHQHPFISSENRITDNKIYKDHQEQSYRIIENHFKDDRKIQSQKLQRKMSWINELRNESNEQLQRLKDDYCRVWYEKLALQSSYALMVQQNVKKDELINQLKLQLQVKNNSNQGNMLFNIPNTNSNHQNNNKSLNHHYPIHTQINQQSNQWGSIQQNRNFQINNNFRNNF